MTKVFFINAGVELHFTQESYSINEGQIETQVCVEIASGIIVIDVPFVLETMITSLSTAEGIHRKINFINHYQLNVFKLLFSL